MEWHLWVVYGAICFQYFGFTAGSDETNLFHNHRRNRILLMKDEVFNFTATSNDPIANGEFSTQKANKGDKGSTKNSISTKRHTTKDGKQQFKDRHQQTNKENKKRRLGTMKEVIPSVMFSHNGTYKYGASPKVVQNATISYKTTQGKKFKVIHNDSKKNSVMVSFNGTNPVIASTGIKRQFPYFPPFNQTIIAKVKRKSAIMGEKRQLPYFPPTNDTAAVVSKRQFPYFPPLSQVFQPVYNNFHSVVGVETMDNMRQEKRKMGQNTFL